MLYAQDFTKLNDKISIKLKKSLEDSSCSEIELRLSEMKTNFRKESVEKYHYSIIKIFEFIFQNILLLPNNSQYSRDDSIQ